MTSHGHGIVHLLLDLASFDLGQDPVLRNSQSSWPPGHLIALHSAAGVADALEALLELLGLLLALHGQQPVGLQACGDEAREEEEGGVVGPRRHGLRMTSTSERPLEGLAVGGHGPTEDHHGAKEEDAHLQRLAVVPVRLEEDADDQ